ncbi:hypothetical protein Hypma_013486 [Hypsizygus marmoreus]|uniref:Uncharacterized protein n=1 Tax=Hypsizygus marmoreus TaxID=39966 RepID=A0A369JBZ1_HYPMA|nr:hypothetical protein Hypma_013486 [Hypsizygus marmoreus]
MENAPVYIYGDFFKFSTQHTSNDTADGSEVFVPTPGIDMFLLERHRRSNGARVGDVFPLSMISQVVELIPCFGMQIHDGLNCNTSLDGDHGFGDRFYLNNYATKETFHAILSYQ